VYTGEVADSRQLASTSDRVVEKTGQVPTAEPTRTSTASLSSAASSAGPVLVAEDSASEPSSNSQQLPASGWTARRSTTEVSR
jgi:hypothetical protein